MGYGNGLVVPPAAYLGWIESLIYIAAWERHGIFPNVAFACKAANPAVGAAISLHWQFSLARRPGRRLRREQR